MICIWPKQTIVPCKCQSCLPSFYYFWHANLHFLHLPTLYLLYIYIIVHLLTKPRLPIRTLISSLPNHTRSSDKLIQCTSLMNIIHILCACELCRPSLGGSTDPWAPNLERVKRPWRLLQVQVDRQIDHTWRFTPSQPRRVITGQNKMYSYHKYKVWFTTKKSTIYTYLKGLNTHSIVEKLGENEVEWAGKAETR